MISEKIRVREALKSDAGLIADLSHKTFYDSVGRFNSKENMEAFMNGDFSKDKLMAEVGEGSHIFLLAYWGNQPAGYVKLKENDPPKRIGNPRAIEIARIYVIQTAIGKGLGRALIERCLEIAMAKGKKVVWLGVWEHNHHAIAFYEKCGFKRFGEHIFMLGKDPQTDWLMKKTLRVL